MLFTAFSGVRVLKIFLFLGVVLQNGRLLDVLVRFPCVLLAWLFLYLNFGKAMLYHRVDMGLSVCWLISQGSF